jgi:hypothetical protein
VTSDSLIHVLCYLEVALCAGCLFVLFFRRQWKDYAALGCFFIVRIFSDSVLIFLKKAAAIHFISKVAAYDIYFYVYWPSFAVESVLALIIVYSVYKLAMAPLKGLQALGMLVFKWAAGISFAVALSSAFQPGIKGTALIVSAISQVQRTQSILTLCLLLFVCFAVKPMGLSYSSRIFGVSLGLGMMATNNLVQSAWLSFLPAMDSTYGVINALVTCGILATWAGYFALPEPKRRIIVLPTTSPFLRWNQISQALGDNPGFVAVGGVPPELFAPAELEVMRRASVKMSSSVAQFPAPVLAPERMMISRAI